MSEKERTAPQQDLPEKMPLNAIETIFSADITLTSVATQQYTIYCTLFSGKFQVFIKNIFYFINFTIYVLLFSENVLE